MKNQRYLDIGGLIGMAKYVLVAVGLICSVILNTSKRVASILNMDGAFNVASAGGIQKIDFVYMRMVNVR
jgi:hypothetical protein|tara:strand:+ start:387 stop:596 length:210 start_codon:yes stop_codon:yes gene_type:complete